jgi:hypothetical protein
MPGHGHVENVPVPKRSPGPVLPVESVFLENPSSIGRMNGWGWGAAADGIRGVTPGRRSESRAFGEARDARWETDPAIWKGPHG